MVSLSCAVFCIRMGGVNIMTDGIQLGAFLLVKYGAYIPDTKTLHLSAVTYLTASSASVLAKYWATGHSKRLL